MKDLLDRFTSRKFLLAAGSFAVLLANGQFGEAAAVVIAFIGLEGAADVVARKARVEIEAFEAANELTKGE
jgi:hypothetical protein